MQMTTIPRNGTFPGGRSAPAVASRSATALPADTFAPHPPATSSSLQQLRTIALRSGRSPQTRATTDEVRRSFPGRQGYDANFLGERLDLPRLDPSIRGDVAPLLDSPNEHVLNYTHFSIVMNKARRMPFYTVVNVDGAKSVELPRNGQWAVDARIAREHQLGNEIYTDNPIDRGHLVRRQDPIWGDQASQAGKDTFVYTNAAPQHEDLNQKEWRELEEHILDHARAQDQKLTVLTGPVFRDDDPIFDNKGRVNPPAQIPEDFWKLVVWNDPDEGLRGAAFVLSQEDLVGDSARASLFQAELPVGRFKVYQVPIHELEQMTKLDFGDIQSSLSTGNMIRDLSDVAV